MTIMEKVRERARAIGARIVLPEGGDERIVGAAARAAELGVARPVLLGRREQVLALAEKQGATLSGVEIVDHERSERLPEFAREFHRLRAHKGVTEAQAEEIVRKPIYFADLMVRAGLADGCVAGAATTTGDVIRAAIYCIGLAPGVSTVSSSFLMIIPDDVPVPEHILMFAGCAVIPQPTPEQLADIAIATAATRRSLVGDTPVIAMLSFSTKGSAEHRDVTKVIDATRIAHERAPGLEIDGELQADAALIPSVGKKKAPGSAVAGRANVLVFPDLDAGNISYKLVQRLAKAAAIGPIIQGVAKPVNDLSRGASVLDIADLIAITAARTGK